MFYLSDIEKKLGVEFISQGNPNLSFSNIAPIFETKNDSLSWIKKGNPNIDTIIKNNPASFIICEKGYVPNEDTLKKKCLVQVDRPDIAFLRLVKNLYEPKQNNETAIHPTAIVHHKAQIGKNVLIGAFSIIDECEIGDNSVIASNVVVKDRVFIKSNVLISEFCNIGGQGFGHIRNEHGKLENMLHIGKVIIDDSVDIFPYSNIDRATLSETHIYAGAKIDHYCHVGHNTSVGIDSILTAKVVLCGGSSIGNNSLIGVGSVIRDGIRVGNNVKVGMGSMVTKDIGDNEVWLGNPAREIEEFKMMNSYLKRIKNK